MEYSVETKRQRIALSKDDFQHEMLLLLMESLPKLYSSD
ncbi:MAG: hypothetical protein ACI84K_000385 [Pseudohongiellaceae bacterium]|jgi:hypothetical protein